MAIFLCNVLDIHNYINLCVVQGPIL